MLNGGDEIILAKWLNKKSLKYTVNNDRPIKLLGYSYALVNRTILCNCELEAEESFLCDLLAACPDNP